MDTWSLVIGGILLLAALFIGANVFLTWRPETWKDWLLGCFYWKTRWTYRFRPPHHFA